MVCLSQRDIIFLQMTHGFRSNLLSYCQLFCRILYYFSGIIPIIPSEIGINHYELRIVYSYLVLFTYCLSPVFSTIVSLKKESL